MKKISICIILTVFLILPLFILAADVDTSYVTNLINGGLTILSRLIFLLISLAVVWFIWNVIRYAMSEDESGKEKAKSQMIWGIIAIAVIVSVWGLVAILRGFFGVDVADTLPTGIGNMIPG